MSDDETRKLESIKFAQESAKQIITLTTAIVTFIFGAVSVGAIEPHGLVLWFLSGILLLLVVSTVAGIVTLFSLSGILSSRDVFSAENPLNSTHYSRFGRSQFFTFVGAILLISCLVLVWPKKSDQNPSSISCQVQNSELRCKIMQGR